MVAARDADYDALAVEARSLAETVASDPEQWRGRIPEFRLLLAKLRRRLVDLALGDADAVRLLGERLAHDLELALVLRGEAGERQLERHAFRRQRQPQRPFVAILVTSTLRPAGVSLALPCTRASWELA